MADLAAQYGHLRFTRDQIFLDREEALTVAQDFWGTSVAAERFTDKDLAFVQGCLLIAVDTSEKSGMLFDLYSSAVKAVPKKSVQSLVKSLAKRSAKRWFSNIIDDDPKVSAVGKSAVQYSELTAEWRTRWQTEDPSFLTNFLIE
jgi:hypothetical protein